MTDPKSMKSSSAPRGPWEEEVTASPSYGTEASFETIRRDIDIRMREAKDRVEGRLRGQHLNTLEAARKRNQSLLRESRNRVRSLLNGGAITEAAVAEPAEPESATAFSIHDLHTLERLLSYVRHSVVRVCFYNLKMFCPSLVDEFDAYVRDQVVTNIDQLDNVQREIETFFDQPLSDGKTVQELYPAAKKEALAHLAELASSAKRARHRLDNEAERERFAERAPKLIDDVMDALHGIQAELDEEKVSVADMIDEVLALAQPTANQAGLTIYFTQRTAPKIFMNRSRCLNAFLEVVNNAIKYSSGSQLTIHVKLTEDGKYVEIRFEDDGRGMTADELATCLNRGTSSGGTGEGLPMALRITEEEHLGEFHIDAAPDNGCRIDIRLPVKLDLQQK